MSNLYSLDNIRTALKKELDQDKALRAAWQAVSYKTKKDGKPFANLGKNIDGATISQKSYSLRPAYEKELCVSSFSGPTGYVSDTIDLSKNADRESYLTAEQAAKKENIIPADGYLCSLYIYDLDDIKQAIADRIAYYDQQIEELTASLDRLDNVFSRFAAAYRAAMQELANDTADLKNKSMYYMVRDTVKERYPYL